MEDAVDADRSLDVIIGAVTERGLSNNCARSATERRRATLGGGVFSKTVPGVSGTGTSLVSVWMLDRSSSSYADVLAESDPSSTGVEGRGPSSGIHALSKVHFFAFCVGFRVGRLRGGVFGRSGKLTSKLRVKGHWVFSYCNTCPSTSLNCSILALSSSVSKGNSIR